MTEVHYLDRPDNRDLSEIQGDYGLPLIGNALTLAANPLKFCDDRFQRYGEISRFAMGPSRVVLALGPDTVQPGVPAQQRIGRKIRMAGRCLLTGPTDANACSDVVANGTGSDLSCSENWDEFSPRVGVDYDFTDDIMGYASISSGFRSGVYNGRPTATEQISVADPETLLSYEVGLKSQLWDNRLQINGALFYNDYQDRQFLVGRPSGSADTALALIVDNAADSTMWGGELEFTVLPLEGLTISGGLSYIDPEYDEFESVDPASGELQDLSDRPFSNVPEWTANLMAQYVYEFDGAGSLRLRGDMSYKDDIFYVDDFESNSFDRLHADSYVIYNAGISYLTVDGKWEFSVFGRNLGDKREIRGGFGVDAFGNTTVSYTEPRRYFVSFRYRS